jgi:hypothetical protein
MSEWSQRSEVPCVPNPPTPPRALWSVRRTICLDMLPASDPTVTRLAGSARELLTLSDLTQPFVFSTASIDVQVGRRRTVESLAVAPANHAFVVELVGKSATSGFRARLRSAAEEYIGTMEYGMLDEVPVCLMLASAPEKAGSIPILQPTLDVCAGWVTGGWLSDNTATGGTPRSRATPMRQDVTEDVTDLDPSSWHSCDRLPAGAVRRVRRLDLTLPNCHSIQIESMFRDVMIGDDGELLVLHEYELIVRARQPDLIVTGVEPTARVLPGKDCPNAQGSVQRLLGRALPDVLEITTNELVGVTTCTHLNDAVRALQAVPSMMDHLLSHDPSTASSSERSP